MRIQKPIRQNAFPTEEKIVLFCLNYLFLSTKKLLCAQYKRMMKLKITIFVKSIFCPSFVRFVCRFRLMRFKINEIDLLSSYNDWKISTFRNCVKTKEIIFSVQLHFALPVTGEMGEKKKLTEERGRVSNLHSF